MFKQKAKIKVLLATAFLSVVFLACSAGQASAYVNTASFVSPVKDFGFALKYGVINWTQVTPVSTNIVMEVRGGNVAAADGSWTAWSAVSNNGSLAVLDGKRYAQYRATLNSDDINAAAGVQDITFNAYQGIIISSPFNTQNYNETLQALSWSETKPGTSDVLFQARTSPDGVNWSPWCGPDNGGAGCDSSTYFTDPAGGEAVDTEFKDQNSDMWIQYRTILVGDIGNGTTPVLANVNLAYVTNPYVSTFTSPIKDTGYPSGFGVLSWTDNAATLNVANPLAQATVTMRIRAGNTATPDGIWTPWSTVANGGSLAAFSGNRYIQYEASLSTYDFSGSLGVSDVTIPYTQFPLGAFKLTSSAYNSGDIGNLLINLAWTENLPTGTNIKFQIRTAPDNNGNPNWSAGSGWCGPTNCAASKLEVDYSSDYYQHTPTGAAINPLQKAGNNDQWIQYVVWLETSSTGKTPTLSNTQITYIVNVQPEVQNVTASQDDQGQINLTYQVKDPDTTTGRNPGKLTTSLQYCSANCNNIGNETWEDATATTNLGQKDVNQDTFTQYSASWNPKVDYPGHFKTDFKVRMKVDDTELANNLAYSSSPAFTLDTKPAVINGVAVNLQNETITIQQPQEDSHYDIYLTTNQTFPQTPQLTNAQNLTYPYTFSYQELTSIDTTGTVSVKIIDQFQNVSTPYAYIAPPKPERLVYFDISNSSVNLYSELLTWKAVSGDNLSYQVCRAQVDDGTVVTDKAALSYDVCHTIASISSNFYIDTNLDTNKHYYYRVFSQNILDGSISNLSNIVEDTPNGNGASDSTPPKIYNVSVDETNDVSATSIIINWKADEISNSGLGYTTQADYDKSQYDLEKTNYAPEMIEAGQTHTYILTGLEPSTTYYLRPKSSDILGNQGVAGNWGADKGSGIITIRTKDGPAIKKFSIDATTNTSITISWSTTTDSNSQLFYSKTKTNGQLIIPDQTPCTYDENNRSEEHTS